ncbi:alpha-galactosidase [Kitasatospora gansuensis]|uniref:Alpha-galactosidase n=1 Tax=Kitasatospora gansuensis TaxID=258050 RepID=A0A7W7SBN1_9ACTN|nr:glycoside hydrolase family 36 protein [Kitasatospora gansuensis]MBB4947526.1 alpha-galactosidase [Kitasatospora gansuensis]
MSTDQEAVTTAELTPAVFEPLLDQVSIAVPDGHWSSTELPSGLRLVAVEAGGGPVEVRLTVPLGDAAGYWHPQGGWRRTLPADWEGRAKVSLVDALATGCLFDHAGATLLTFAAADPVPEAELRFGVSEETDSFVVQLRLPPSADPHRLLFVPRSPTVAGAMRALRSWYAAGVDPMPVPEGARTPVYSTWYAFNQRVDAESVEQEAALAAQLGFGALILDDGWQLGGHGRGYAGCGDWRPDPAKFPDLAAHVRRVRADGLRYLLWTAPLLVGPHSEAYRRWAPTVPATVPGAYVLDPRKPEVRRHVIELCASLVQEFGVDGLKLDFLDEAMVHAGDGGPDVGRAMTVLLTELRAELEPIRPGLLLELRQPYVGPGMAPFGNLLRSFDCPADSTANRVRTLDTAFLAVGGAVHSDMLLWPPEAPAHSAARQLIGALHAVPQVSVRLTRLPEEHLAAVAFWLGQWRRLRDTLLDGEVEPGRPDELYPVVRVSGDRVLLVSVHAEQVVPVALTRHQELVLVNGSATDRLVLEVAAPGVSAELAVHGPTGRIIERSRLTLPPGLHSLPVPRSGLAILTSLEGTA